MNPQKEVLWGLWVQQRTKVSGTAFGVAVPEVEVVVTLDAKVPRGTRDSFFSLVLRGNGSLRLLLR